MLLPPSWGTFNQGTFTYIDPWNIDTLLTVDEIKVLNMNFF